MKVWKIEFELETEDEIRKADIKDFIDFKLNTGEGYFASTEDEKTFKVKLTKRVKDNEDI